MTLASPKSPKSSAKKKTPAKSASSNRSAFKYGSKMTAMCLDNVIARHVAGAVNPELTAKWLQKMKLSILRKVSACSKVAFLNDAQQPSTLRAEIDKEKETIVEKKEKVVEAARRAASKANLKKMSANTAAKPTPPRGDFDAHVKTVGERLLSVAKSLTATTKNVDSRIDSLTSTMGQVGADWKSKAASKKGVKKPAPAAAAAAKEEASNSGSSSSSSGGKPKSNPLNKLHQHLNR